MDLSTEGTHSTNSPMYRKDLSFFSDAGHGLLFDEAGKTGAKAETLGMWNVLWVQQGQSFGALDIPSTARSSLHSALEAEVGTVLGGRRGRALPQVVEAKLDVLVTSGGKPRGSYTSSEW